MPSPLCAGCLLVNRNDGAVAERLFKVGVATYGFEKTLEFEKEAIILCPRPGIRGLSRRMRLKPPPNLIRHPETLRVQSTPHFRSLNQKSDTMGTLIVHKP